MSAKIIFDSKSEIPPHLQAEAKEVDGKYELDAQGVLNKNRELLGKNSTLSETNQELEGKVDELKKQVVSKGQIAIDKSEFDALKNENEAYKALGALDEIKPKVEGFDQLKTETKQAVKDKALMSLGITDIARAKGFKAYDALDIEVETKDGKEVFYNVSLDEKGKPVKTAFNEESLKGDSYKDNLGTLFGTEGKKMFRQVAGGGSLSKAERIKAEVKEKEAARGNVAKSFVEAFSGTNPN